MTSEERKKLAQKMYNEIQEKRKKREIIKKENDNYFFDQILKARKKKSKIRLRKYGGY